MLKGSLYFLASIASIKAAHFCAGKVTRAAGLDFIYRLIYKEKLPRNSTHNDQQQWSILVGKLIENSKGEHIQNCCRPDLRCCNHHLSHGLVLHLVKGALDTGFENLRSDDGYDTNN